MATLLLLAMSSETNTFSSLGPQNALIEAEQYFIETEIDAEVLFDKYQYPDSKRDYRFHIDTDLSILHNASSPHAV